MLVSTIPGDGLQGVILETSVWILEIGLIKYGVCADAHETGLRIYTHASAASFRNCGATGTNPYDTCGP